jgi:2-oxoglutarate dehydrogenase E2 component (dihydrolipoamide succinyltransferase)
MAFDVVIPQLGESVVEGTLTKWAVKAGDIVTSGQTLATVSTDKADSDVPAPKAGRVVALLLEEGATVPVGTPFLQMEEGSFEAPAAPAAAAAAPVPAAGAPLAAPSVRQAAREADVDLSNVKGSGENGRITKDDVARASTSTSAPAAPAPAPTSAPAPAAYKPPPAPTPVQSGGFTFLPPVPNVGFGSFKVPAYIEKPGDKVIPFSRKRRITADHMVYSKFVSPQVVTVAEVDLHRVMKLREQHKDRYKKEGLSLTVLAFVCMATVRALRQFPSLNARVIDGATVQLRDVNLGVAVDAPDGLVVPNLKGADELSLRGLARGIGDVATRARDGKLTADDFSSSSFTVTNPGLKGNLFGGAIISQPNVGILRMGEIKKRVVVVEDEEAGDQIAIHPVMYMALSYDHRVVDGVMANGFLWTVGDILRRADFEP